MVEESVEKCSYLCVHQWEWTAIHIFILIGFSFSCLTLLLFQKCTKILWCKFGSSFSRVGCIL